MFIAAYKKTWEVLSKKPIRLWGLSLLSGVITFLITISVGLVPILSMAASGVVTCGMAKVYIDGLEEKEVNSDQLFEGFQRFTRVAGGVLWKKLWMVIWFMIPIVGIVFMFVKAYQYRFVPYILMTKPDVTATQALRLSMEETKGKRMQMFLADLVYIGSVVVACLLLGLLSRIPGIGIVFLILMIVLLLAVVAFGGIFMGLYEAAFYTGNLEVAETKATGKFCPGCGQKNENSAIFCVSCGRDLR